MEEQFRLAEPAHRTELPARREAVREQGSDADEFATLFEEHRTALLSFCLSRTHDRALAEDIVQDVFEAAYSTRSRFDTARPFWPWIASIAARDCTDALRRRAYARSRVADLARVDAIGPFDSTSNAVLTRDERLRLERQIHALPPRQRVALLLFALDGWTYAEIAAQLHCTIGTVKALIVRARRKVRLVGERGLAAAFGGVRAVQARWRKAADRLPVTAAAYGEVLAAWVHALAGAPAKAAVVVVASALVVPVVGGGGTDAPDRRPSARPPQAASSSGDPTPAPGGPDTTLAPAAAPSPPAEPPLRRHTGYAERAANDALAPLLYRTPVHGALEDAYATSIVVSPAYERDRTAFVLGVDYEVGHAQPLFVTHDGGASWTRRRAIGLGSDPVSVGSQARRRLVLPPAYPTDDRLFAVTDRGLQVSRDEGETFETVLAVTGVDDFSFSPAFAHGDPTALLVVGGRLLEYHDDTGLAPPLSPAGGPIEHAVAARHNVDYPADPTIFVGTRGSGTPGAVPSILRCVRKRDGLPPLAQATTDSLACAGTRLPEGYSGTFGLRASPDALYVVTPFALFVSSDDGRTFRRSQPVPAEAVEFAYANDLSILGATTGSSAVVARYSERWTGDVRTGYVRLPAAPLLRTDDAGRTWTPLDLDVPEPTAAVAVATTPTGRIIAVVGGRIVCSADAGRTWGRTCPTPDAA